jgi:hypothetical protein
VEIREPGDVHVAGGGCQREGVVVEPHQSELLERLGGLSRAFRVPVCFMDLDRRSRKVESDVALHV